MDHGAWKSSGNSSGLVCVLNISSFYLEAYLPHKQNLKTQERKRKKKERKKKKERIRWRRKKRRRANLPFLGLLSKNLNATSAPPDQVWKWYDSQNHVVKQTKTCKSEFDLNTSWSIRNTEDHKESHRSSWGDPLFTTLLPFFYTPHGFEPFSPSQTRWRSFPTNQSDCWPSDSVPTSGATPVSSGPQSQSFWG